MKLILSLLILILLNNCSLNKNSKYWTEDVVLKNDNEKKLSITLEKPADIAKMSIEEYEIYIDDYTKRSKYPDISQ
jgi:hypothetical protein